jgi:hypothetical protein
MNAGADTAVVNVREILRHTKKKLICESTTL